MFKLSSGAKTECCLVVDIGSGSVGMALAVNKTNGKMSDVIWSHREAISIKKTTEHPTLKKIETALLNGFLEFGANGFKALREHKLPTKIELVQVSVSAPWSHTVSKYVNYCTNTPEKPFIVNDELIDQLAKAADNEITRKADEAKIKDNDLTIVHQQTIDYKVNGYHTTKKNTLGNCVEVSHITELVEKSLVDAINESAEKILPSAEITINSFMHIYYAAMKNMRLDTSEACLLDVTNEAIEIGIVRDNILTYSTHTLYGSHTLARELADLCRIPDEEAYGLLQEETDSKTKKLPVNKCEQAYTTFSALDMKLASLFHETGDNLSIPGTIILHTERAISDFFVDHIKAAAKDTTGQDHVVLPISTKLFPKASTEDTAILLSVYYFSRQLGQK